MFNALRCILLFVFAGNASASSLSLEKIEIGMTADQALANYNHCETTVRFDELKLTSCDNTKTSDGSVYKDVIIDNSLDKVVATKVELGFASFAKARESYDMFVDSYDQPKLEETTNAGGRFLKVACYGECSNSEFGAPLMLIGVGLQIVLSRHTNGGLLGVYLIDQEAMASLHKKVHTASYAQRNKGRPPVSDKDSVKRLLEIVEKMKNE